jgi:hypothetical protein
LAPLSGGGEIGGVIGGESGGVIGGGVLTAGAGLELL